AGVHDALAQVEDRHLGRVVAGAEGGVAAEDTADDRAEGAGDELVPVPDLNAVADAPLVELEVRAGELLAEPGGLAPLGSASAHDALEVPIHGRGPAAAAQGLTQPPARPHGAPEDHRPDHGRPPRELVRVGRARQDRNPGTRGPAQQSRPWPLLHHREVAVAVGRLQYVRVVIPAEECWPAGRLREPSGVPQRRPGGRMPYGLPARR